MTTTKLAFLSPTPGISGHLKATPEDFVVEEIGLDGTIYARDTEVTRPDSPDGKFCHFVLQKIEWSTPSALRALSERMHVNPKRLEAAGNKDRQAVTVQLCSAFGIEPRRILGVRLKDVRILGAWKASHKVAIGDVLGNRFSIKVEGAEGTEEEKQAAVARILGELGLINSVFPNYFGSQRFGGERANTAQVGLCLLRNDTKGAVTPKVPMASRSQTIS